MMSHGTSCDCQLFLPACLSIHRPATHPDLIGISRFFSTNLGVSRFPDSTGENPEFLFRFEIGKTKGRLTLLHGPCLQTHKVWAKNKCYDRLNPLHTATQPVSRLGLASLSRRPELGLT